MPREWRRKHLTRLASSGHQRQALVSLAGISAHGGSPMKSKRMKMVISVNTLFIYHLKLYKFISLLILLSEIEQNFIEIKAHWFLTNVSWKRTTWCQLISTFWWRWTISQWQSFMARFWAIESEQARAFIFRTFWGNINLIWPKNRIKLFKKFIIKLNLSISWVVAIIF